MDRAFLDAILVNNEMISSVQVATCTELFTNLRVSICPLDSINKEYAYYNKDFSYSGGLLYGETQSYLASGPAYNLQSLQTVYSRPVAIDTVVTLLNSLISLNNAYLVPKNIGEYLELNPEFIGTGVVKANKIRISQSTMTILYPTKTANGWKSEVIVDSTDQLEIIPFYFATPEEYNLVPDFVESKGVCTINGEQLYLYKTKEDLPLFDYEEMTYPIVKPLINRLSHEIVLYRSSIVMLKELLRRNSPEEEEEIKQTRVYAAKSKNAPQVYFIHGLKPITKESYYDILLMVADHLQRLEFNKDLDELAHIIFSNVLKEELDYILSFVISVLASCYIKSEEDFEQLAPRFKLPKVDHNVLQEASSILESHRDLVSMLELSAYAMRLSLIKTKPPELLRTEILASNGGAPSKTTIGGKNLHVYK